MRNSGIYGIHLRVLIFALCVAALGIAGCIPYFNIPDEGLRIKPLKTAYAIGGSIDTTLDLEVNKVEKNGSLTRLYPGDFSLSPEGTLDAVGVQTIVVTAGELSGSYTVQVENTGAAASQVQVKLHKVGYMIGEFISKSDDLTVYTWDVVTGEERQVAVDGFELSIAGPGLGVGDLGPLPAGALAVTVRVPGYSATASYTILVDNPRSAEAYDIRELIDVQASPGQSGDYTLTLDFGPGAIAGLEKADINLTTTDPDCLLSKQGVLEPVVGWPGKYTLKIGAVVKTGAACTKAVTVSAGGQKPGSPKPVWLTGSKAVDITFQPLAGSRYKVFHLAAVFTDGMIDPPIADTKLTLTLVAASQDSLPPIQSASDILLSMMTVGMTVTKGAVNLVSSVSGSPASQTWELGLSQVNKSGTARVEVSVDGYVQDNRMDDVPFHGVGIAFNSAEEVWGPANVNLNDGTKTRLILSFSRDIPRFTISDLSIRSLTTIANLVLSNLQHTGIGEYTVDVSWGTPDNWRHEANLTVAPADTMIVPQTQKVFLSMRKVDNPGTGNQIALRRVPPGTFQRDANAASISELSKAFWLGETEVTNGLWFEVMGYYPGYRLNAPNPVDTKGYYNSLSGDILTTPRVPAIDDYPVHNVSWLEAIVFCNKLSLLHGKAPVYNVNLAGWTSQVDYSTGTPTTAAHVDQDGDGWINDVDWAEFRTGSGLIPDPAIESDWPYLYISSDYSEVNGFKTFNDVQTDLHKWKNNTQEGMVSINTTATGYRLPFYHQWLWAAMGADMSPARLSGGVNRLDYFKSFAGANGNNNLSDYVWTAGNSGMAFQKAGTKKPNELGVYDLSGNMSEWLFDQIQRTYTEFPFLGTMGDDDYYYAGGDDWGVPTFSWGGSYYGSIIDLSFGFYADNLRPIYNTESHIQDGFSNIPYQGFRVMRWVGNGE